MSNVKQQDDTSTAATEITVLSSTSASPASSAQTTPTRAISKNRKKLKDLNDIITCSLCQGYFIEATTINECVHTCKYIFFFVYSLDGLN